jgi:hypothetical protein
MTGKHYLIFQNQKRAETKNLRKEDQKKEFYSIENFINDNLKKFEKNNNIHKKYEWLKKNFNNSIDQYNF